MNQLITNSQEIKNIDLIVNKNQEQEIIIFDIDADEVECDINITVEENATLKLKIASYGKNNKKSYNINIINKGKRSNSDVECYGISDDNSKMFFNVSTKALKGAIGGVVKQRIKTVNVGINVQVLANPILLIDELECYAAHAATNSKISDEELFYMQTRGIGIEMAKNLITEANLLIVLENANSEIKEAMIRKIKGIYDARS